MARGEEPLFAQDRPSSELSDERNVEEEDALLAGQHKSQRRRYDWGFWREIGLFAWAVIATVLVIVFGVLYHRQQASRSNTSGGPSGKRNLIFMVSDGMGPTSLSLTRSFRQVESGLPIDSVLVLDQHLIGSSRTRSTSSLITDSAAGATAFSCGLKSYNGAISMLPDQSPCGTVLEAAKKAGYLTGLVVTTRITDATPACFAAHVNSRSEEDRIAEQEVGDHPLGQVVDLILGGGRCHFLPNTTDGSCRGDDKDVVALAKQNGFSYIDNRKDFDGLKLGSSVKLPLLGLVANLDIPYEVDRRKVDDVYPSLDELARTALRALSDATKDREQGFFLMIEGSRIDHAGHANDPVAQVHEVLAYDKAFASVLDFLENDDVEGVLVGTSDHETGGLATARQLHDAYPEYQWFPDMLINATHSSENLAHQLRVHLDGQKKKGLLSSRDDSAAFIRHELLERGLGVYDATDEEVNRLIDESDPWPAAYHFADIISRRAEVGWTTHGHSAADVNIYTSDPHQAKALIGNHENTAIGEFIRDYLNLDLDTITHQLKTHDAREQQEQLDPSSQQKQRQWKGKPLPEGKTHANEDHYHGDFKKRSLNCDGGHLH